MSLPSKLTSYLAAGRPILAAVAKGGASHCELLGTGGAAYAVAPGDPARLAEALRALSVDGVRRQAMSAAGAAYAADHLGREDALQALVALLLRPKNLRVTTAPRGTVAGGIGSEPGEAGWPSASSCNAHRGC
jgi:glycosyltransferase involved in cell wall biosynthesis